MTPIKVNQRKRNAIRRKSVGKTRKDDLSDPSSSNNSDSSYNSDYRRKKLKRKSDRKNDPIKLCAHLTAKLLMTAYKSKIIRFKMDEDTLQRRIYFPTFVESLGMIFDLYAVVSKFSVKCAHNLIGSFFRSLFL